MYLALSSSFTKSKLTEIISTGLTQETLLNNRIKPSKKGEFKIMSIDVGIKNFSYCKIQIDAQDPFQKPIIVKEWNKLNILNWTNNPADLEFCPKHYSLLSSDIIFGLILKEEVPDLILIERQRFRSMGSSSVLEHIIKSAVLENMLFASLNALKKYDGKFQYRLQSSSPLTMSSYWDSYKTIDNYLLDKSTASSKNQRIELVSNWILNSNNNKLVVLAINDEYKTKFSKIKNDSRKLFEIVNHINGNELKRADTEKLKGDDLADSLLHGITWLDFEKNKLRLLSVLYSSPNQLLEELKSIELEHIAEVNEARLLYSNDIE